MPRHEGNTRRPTRAQRARQRARVSRAAELKRKHPKPRSTRFADANDPTIDGEQSSLMTGRER